MKKTLFTIATALICIISVTSCQNLDDIIYIKVEDGTGKLVECSVMVSDEVSELFGHDINSVKEIVKFASTQMRRECKYPRTYVPDNFFLNDLKVGSGGKFIVSVLVSGYAQNGFGVEDRVIDVFEVTFYYSHKNITIIK